MLKINQLIKLFMFISKQNPISRYISFFGCLVYVGMTRFKFGSALDWAIIN